MSDIYEQHLAPYAVCSDECGGCMHPEPDEPFQSPFEWDRHRIITSTAFRRLNGKTQVFAPAFHDHFRSRLTHTLEATQIARYLAVRLRTNEYLAEAITLAHDLGHPPFGHAGESALDTMMVSHGGFNHNTHTLRVVDYLEHPFPPFRGLNLTAETRAGLMTHITCYDQPDTHYDHPSVEAQIASLADRIAYNVHDLEDAIGAEIIDLKDLNDLAIWRDAYQRTAGDYRDKNIHTVRRVVLDAILHDLFADILETSQNRLATVSSLREVKSSTTTLITPSQEVDRQLSELEQFLMENVYRDPEIVKTDTQGQTMIQSLFDTYRVKPDAMPERFTNRIDELGLDHVICDYIAGMTDRFCRQQFEKHVHA